MVCSMSRGCRFQIPQARAASAHRLAGIATIGLLQPLPFEHQLGQLAQRDGLAAGEIVGLAEGDGIAGHGQKARQEIVDVDRSLARPPARHQRHHREALHEIGVELEFETTIAIVDQGRSHDGPVQLPAGGDDGLAIPFRARIVRGVGIDHRRRGDVDEVGDAGRLGRRGHVAGAFDVDRLEELDLLAQEDRGQVVDDLDPGEGRGQGLRFRHVTVVDLRGVAQARGQRIARQDQGPHPVTLLAEAAHHARADLARGARDENGHGHGGAKAYTKASLVAPAP